MKPPKEVVPLKEEMRKLVSEYNRYCYLVNSGAWVEGSSTIEQDLLKLFAETIKRVESGFKDPATGEDHVECWNSYAHNIKMLREFTSPKK